MGNNHQALTTKRFHSRLSRYVLISLAIFQIIVMYDTFRNKTIEANLKGNTEKMSKKITYIHNAEKESTENDDVAETINPSGTSTSTSTYEYTYSDDVENDEADNDSGGAVRRTLYWMDHTAVKDFYYSGSWIQPIEPFLDLRIESMQSLEDASHRVYFENEKNVRMSVDWLDFAVEHLSKWCKKLDLLAPHHNSVAIDKINGNLLTYIQATPAKTKTLKSMLKTESEMPLLHPTIAVISHGAIIRKDTPLSYERGKNLTVTTLGATIASLLRVGVGRIVVTGMKEVDEELAKEAFRLIRAQYETLNGEYIVTTEFSYVKIANETWYKTKSEPINRPKATLYGLQEALNGNLKTQTETDKWLGTVHDESYWKYVYFTEPDLILQTRIASLPAIHKALERGNVLMPHRLQPVTHESDLIGPENTKYNGPSQNLPATGKFKNVIELDGEVDMCCDDGREHPKWDGKDDPADKACYTWWYDCGYTREWQNLGIPEKVKHRRILHYTPLIRLSHGANIISISGSEHERKCRPRKRKTPDDICQRPSLSGRSYATSEK
mmetsp:Transcript_10346/g.24645  ORF Transcript_10346/g.24645 Transcript_10346/m.24645 type:complete len:553 (-) Transcript_10346:175-1833(-)